jgi:hypothetical protein
MFQDSKESWIRLDVSRLKRILDSYCNATGMLINPDKSFFSLNNCSDEETNSFLNLIPTQKKRLEEGIKYLGSL